MITPLAHGLYEVTSERDATKTYIVTPGKACTCPDFAYRQRACKHMIAVTKHRAEQTTLARMMERAATLTDEELIRYAEERAGTPAGCACWLTMAKRQAAEQEAIERARPMPEGIECFLEGATEAERARALAIYK